MYTVFYVVLNCYRLHFVRADFIHNLQVLLHLFCRCFNGQFITKFNAKTLQICFRLLTFPFLSNSITKFP